MVKDNRRLTDLRTNLDAERAIWKAEIAESADQMKKFSIKMVDEKLKNQDAALQQVLQRTMGVLRVIRTHDSRFEALEEQLTGKARPKPTFYEEAGALSVASAK